MYSGHNEKKTQNGRLYSPSATRKTDNEYVHDRRSVRQNDASANE